MRLAILAAALIALAGCQAAAEPAVQQITPEQYDALAPNAVVIDVHVPEQEHLPGTDAVIPYTDVETIMQAAPEKDAPVIVYCRSGSMSAQTAQALADEGYTQVYDLAGGRNAYVAAN